MTAPLVFFIFEELPEDRGVYGLAPTWFASTLPPTPTDEFAVYGLGSDWFATSAPPFVDVVERGCFTCELVRRFAGGLEIHRFKRTRAGINIVPYCPKCYTYNPKE